MWSKLSLPLPSFIFASCRFYLLFSRYISAYFTRRIRKVEDNVPSPPPPARAHNGRQAFKHDFKDVVKTLGTSAYFTPYYVIYDGDSYGCTGVCVCVCVLSVLSDPMIFGEDVSGVLKISGIPIQAPMPLFSPLFGTKTRPLCHDVRRGVALEMTKSSSHLLRVIRTQI